MPGAGEPPICINILCGSEIKQGIFIHISTSCQYSVLNRIFSTIAHVLNKYNFRLLDENRGINEVAFSIFYIKIQLFCSTTATLQADSHVTQAHDKARVNWCNIKHKKRELIPSSCV